MANGMIKRVTAAVARCYERRGYRRLLHNWEDVWRQNAIAAGGSKASEINELRFKDGGIFRAKDGLSAAHTFREIFIRKDYDVPLLTDASTIVDLGANIG